MKVLYIVTILLSLLIIPYSYGLEAFTTYVNVTGNTTDFRVTSEEGASKAYTINSSYSEPFSFIIYRNNSLQDDYDNLSKAFINLSGTYSLLVANITSCINNFTLYNYTIINSTVNITTYYYNYNTTNITYNYKNQTNCTYETESTNLDYFKEYTSCYFNLSIAKADLSTCQTELNNKKGDTSTQDKLTNCQNLLGSYSGSGTNCGAELQACRAETKECTTEGWKIPTIGIICFIAGVIVCYVFIYLRNPKNRGRSAGSDTMTKPFYPT